MQGGKRVKRLKTGASPHPEPTELSAFKASDTRKTAVSLGPETGEPTKVCMWAGRTSMCPFLPVSASKSPQPPTHYCTLTPTPSGMGDCVLEKIDLGFSRPGDTRHGVR